MTVKKTGRGIARIVSKIGKARSWAILEPEGAAFLKPERDASNFLEWLQEAREVGSIRIKRLEILYIEYCLYVEVRPHSLKRLKSFLMRGGFGRRLVDIYNADGLHVTKHVHYVVPVPSNQALSRDQSRNRSNRSENITERLAA